MKTKAESKKSTTECFARNLRRAMEANSYNAMDVARLALVSPSMLTLILKETSNPSIATADIIAAAFGYEGWWMSAPTFDPAISQAHINALLSATTVKSCNNFVREVTDFAKYKDFTRD